jgi:hypothetical protein
MAGDGATTWNCSEACSSKCPRPGIGPFTYANFDPSDFPFVTTLPDDGADKGGGWQEAKARLKFEHLVIPGEARVWHCPITIGMPLRTKLMGRIDSSRAASLSEVVTENVAESMNYKIPSGIFCKQFAINVDAAFSSIYVGLGARATNP